MLRYQLHARSFAGPLNAPTRNELRFAESDDRAELEALADDMREAGWAVWLFEHRPGHPGSLAIPGRGPSLHVLAEW